MKWKERRNEEARMQPNGRAPQNAQHVIVTVDVLPDQPDQYLIIDQMNHPRTLVTSLADAIRWLSDHGELHAVLIDRTESAIIAVRDPGPTYPEDALIAAHGKLLAKLLADEEPPRQGGKQ